MTFHLQQRSHRSTFITHASPKRAVSTPDEDSRPSNGPSQLVTEPALETSSADQAPTRTDNADVSAAKVETDRGGLADIGRSLREYEAAKRDLAASIVTALEHAEKAFDVLGETGLKGSVSALLSRFSNRQTAQPDQAESSAAPAGDQQNE